MKILVLGAGVIGSLYAAGLQDSGQDVTVMARGQRLAELRERGVELVNVTTGEKTTTQVGVVASLAPDDTYDLAIVTVRRNQLSDVLPVLDANHRIPMILFMLNNASGSDEIATAVGSERAVLGFPGAGGAREGGVVRYALAGALQPTTLGELDGRITPRLIQLAQMLKQARFPVAFCRDMDAWLKTHVAIVSPAANAIYMAGGDTLWLSQTRDALVLLIRAVHENFRVLHALGIPITPARLAVLEWLPEPVLLALLRRRLANPLTQLVMAAHANAARDEMRELADEFAALAARTPVATPATIRLRAYLNSAVTPAQLGSQAIHLRWRGIILAVAAAIWAGYALSHATRHLREKPPTAARATRAIWWTNAKKGLLGVAVLGAVLLRQRLTANRMPHLARWQRELARTHGSVDAYRLASRMQQMYDELVVDAGKRRSASNPALRLHLNQMILPGLAAYRALLEEDHRRERVLAEVQSLLALVPSSLGPIRALSTWVPRPFGLLRLAMRLGLAIGFPAEGWQIERIEDSEHTLAFTIHRCFYLDTLTAYGVPELTALYCALDDRAFAGLPGSIQWQRTQTLGRGGTCCDFQWTYRQSPQHVPVVASSKLPAPASSR